MKQATAKQSFSEIPPLNLLVAFPFFKKPVVEYLTNDVPRESYRLIIDSGAFSAFNSGKPIDLDDYCRFLDSVQHLRPFSAVQLDVIGDPEATWKNYKLMRKRGYDVLPVFTRGATEEALEAMYALTDYVLVGGMVGRRDNFSFLKWFSSRVAGRKVHWLGQTDPEAIKAFKPTSVDSSSWVASTAMGNIPLYIGAGRLITLTREDFAKPPDALLRERLRRCGFDAEETRELLIGDNWKSTRSKGPPGPTAIRISVCSHLKRAVEVEQNVGTQIFLACADACDLKFMFWCKNKMLAKGVL